MSAREAYRTDDALVRRVTKEPRTGRQRVSKRQPFTALEVPEIGETFTREEIAARHGGSAESYLPMKRGRVVAVCVRLDYNPGAPKVILPGDRRRHLKLAKLLIRQGGRVPVYVRVDRVEWKFMGQFEAQHLSTNLHETAPYTDGAGRPYDFGFGGVMFLR